MQKKNDKAQPVSKIVEEYMYERPYLLELANQKIINTSSLARKIKQDANIKRSQDAVMVALYRFLQKSHRILPQSNEQKKIVQNTTINIRSDYAVLVADIKKEIKSKNIISYSDKQVCIAEKNLLKQYERDSIYYKENLTLIELRHAKNIEETPGVLFHILAKFYEQSISIMEVFSAWDSTYILIEKKDVQKVINMFFT
jgi:hypothetical protein